MARFRSGAHGGVGTGSGPSPPSVDSAVANISVDVVRSLPARVDARMLVTSGYFLSEQPLLDGYAHVTRRTYDGWAADLHTRN